MLIEKINIFDEFLGLYLVSLKKVSIFQKSLDKI